MHHIHTYFSRKCNAQVYANVKYACLIKHFIQDPRNKAEVLKLRDDDVFHLQSGDEMVNDEALKTEMQIEALCASGNCDTIPDKNLMKIKVSFLINN